MKNTVNECTAYSAYRKGRSRQRGVSLSGFLMVSVVVILAAILTMKVLPSVLEFYKIKKSINAVVAQATAESTVPSLRASFDRFASIDQIEFPSSDLDISKENGQIVIEASYEKRISLFANVSLLIDYHTSTDE